jgi:LCP family protein required for cell wall assembly
VRGGLACLLVAVLTAVVVATAGFLEVGKIADALRQNGIYKLAPGTLKPTAPGQPQTLLLVGDDQRPPPKNNPNGFVVPHSNEMLLVRLDPGKPTIAMLSIPRDLRVTIRPPGQAPTVRRINVAYTIGGIQLMTQTIKQVLGVPVNHVVVITFPRFKTAVNQMGCVYTTIDRRYFHSNAAGGQQYFEVNLQPGYQRVCGDAALQFVAYRHGDTALIRDARDQRFLLDVKAEYGPSLLANRDKFEHIFGKAVKTDIHGTAQVLDLLELLVQMSGRPVRQVHFNAAIGPIFVTATRQQIQSSVNAFLNGVAAIGKHHIATNVRHGSASAGLVLAKTSGAALAQARLASTKLPFALEYPRVENQLGGAQPDSLRIYAIRDQQGHLHSAYTIVVDRGRIGEFYDVQGSGWQDPPLLSNPTQTIKVGARTYGLFYEGDNLRTVAWRDGPATYWITNTLTDTVPPREMLAMAEQTTPVIGVGAGAGGNTKPRTFALPARTAVGRWTTLTTFGAFLGLLGLVGVALLGLRLHERQRSLRQLRAEVEALARLAPAARGEPRQPPAEPRVPVGSARSGGQPLS